MGSHLFSMYLCQFADYNCDFGIIQKLISSKIKWCSGCTWFFEFVKWRCGECNSCDAVIVIMTSLWTAVSQLFLGLQLRYWYQSKAILKRYCVIYRDKHGFVNSSNGISFSFGWIFVFVLGQISWSKTIQPRPLNTQQLKYIYQTHIHGMGILSYSIYYEQLGCLLFWTCVAWVLGHHLHAWVLGHHLHLLYESHLSSWSVFLLDEYWREGFMFRQRI